MKDGFLCAAALSPKLRVADCDYNARQCLESLRQAAEKGARLAVLPELCLTGYTCGDLFLQQTLLEGAESALAFLVKESRDLPLIALAGLPVRAGGKTYNCAAVFCAGHLLGLVPKSYLPNYAEFYEKRHFVPWQGENIPLTFAGRQTLLGTRLLFGCRQMPAFRLGVEVCEDLWAPLPPSTGHALAGATVIANLSASDETVGKAEYRRALVSQQSARLLCGYLYADAGWGESTTDMVFAAHDLIAENGVLLAEAAPFGAGFALTQLDLERMLGERARNTSFEPRPEGYQQVEFDLEVRPAPLTRPVSDAPFVPAGQARRAERCELILTIQARGLAKRMEHARAKTAVIGISGGLDSCLALLAAVRAMELLGRPASDVQAVTMPCFGTTKRTRSNAQILCEELGVSFTEIDITATVRQPFRGHRPRREHKYDVTFENGQARERTLELDGSGQPAGGPGGGHRGPERAGPGLGHLQRGPHEHVRGERGHPQDPGAAYCAATPPTRAKSEGLRRVLLDILDTPVSPELLPAKENGEIAQQTEDLVGPYELHDFYPLPCAAVRLCAGQDPAAGPGAPLGSGTAGTVLLRWLENFYRRFFAQQFKRSCLPDGPKVGSVTLSPRGDWRMPSDACGTLWLAQVAALKEEAEQ